MKKTRTSRSRLKLFYNVRGTENEEKSPCELQPRRLQPSNGRRKPYELGHTNNYKNYLQSTKTQVIVEEEINPYDLNQRSGRRKVLRITK